MDTATFSTFNRIRCESKAGFNHQLGAWSLSDWMVAVLGELGEASNVVKKLNRFRDSIPGNVGETEAGLKAKLADELADAYIYLDLLFQAAGIDFDKAVNDKFMRTSIKIGYPEKAFRASFEDNHA